MYRKIWFLSKCVGLGVVLFAMLMEAATIPGTGTLSGTVEAPKPFQAAQVYARNVDKNVGYMVYTARGQYRAVNMLPGNYTVSVQKNGFAADVKNIVIREGANTVADFSLREAPRKPNGGFRGWVDLTPDVPLVSYDTLYPPGAGREVAERTCIACHGNDFLPSHQWSESQWSAAIFRMTDPRKPQIPPGTISPTDRQTLVAYLTRNFGPNSTQRGVEVVGEMPLDEQALSKAMYVEYYLPRDKEHRVKANYFDRDGNVWFGDPDALLVTKLDPRTATFTKSYSVPERVNSVAVDAEGHVWWAGNEFLGRIDPKNEKLMAYRADPKNETNGLMTVHTVVIDAKQNPWFTDIVGNTLGKWDRESEEISLYKVPTPDSRPYGITTDKNGRIWFVENRACKVAMLDPETGKFTEYDLGYKPPCGMERLGADSKGTIWYGAKRAGKLGKLDPNTGKVVEYNVPMANPYDVWPDREDNIWIGDGGSAGGSLIKFDPRTEKFTYYPSPQTTDVPKVQITREGAIWYATRGGAYESMAVGVLYPDVDKMTTLGAYY